MFQNVFLPPTSRTKWRSTHVKATLHRVGWVGVVGKGLYYHRFVDVLSMGNGMKWGGTTLGLKQVGNPITLSIFQATEHMKVLLHGAKATDNGASAFGHI